MSRMRDIAAVLIATPGMSMREIAHAIGQTTDSQRNCISAALHSLAQAGRVRHNNQPARGARLWYATELALADRRCRTGATHAPLSARRTAPKPPKPPKSADMTIVKKPPEAPKARYAATAKPETVDQWMQRTGQTPERLAPHACSKPLLRFDHSDNTIPTGRRRPTLRARGSNRTTP